MTYFDYTTSADADSSAVDGVYYNENNQDMLVDLHDNLYLYKGVPRKVLDRFYAVTSVGRDWLPLLKREYGPSEHVGDYSDMVFRKVDVMHTAPNGVVAKNLVVTGHNTNISPVYYTLSADATKATEVNSTYYSLSPSTPTPVIEPSRYSVEVRVSGAESTLHPQAGNENDAVREITDVLDALGLDYKIVSVTHYFE